MQKPECEFEWGEEVEVRDEDDEPWSLAIFASLNPRFFEPYYFNEKCDAKFLALPGIHWKQCRKKRQHFEVDEKVQVRDALVLAKWKKGHFAGWSKDGKPQTWTHGKTSWTSEPSDFFVWDEIKKAE